MVQQMMKRKKIVSKMEGKKTSSFSAGSHSPTHLSLCLLFLSNPCLKEQKEKE